MTDLHPTTERGTSALEECGVLLSQHLHVPVARVAKSSEPGFGETSDSLCGLVHNAIVYDYEWLQFHYGAPDLCRWCARLVDAA